MGISSNQARFLSLTSRQVDLEYRMQRICQRRLRLSSELENVATQYNNSISNRKLFVPTQSSLQGITFANLAEIGYKVINNTTNNFVNGFGVMNAPAAADPTAVTINSQEDFMNLVAVMNGGDAAATAALAGKYVLNCDIDLSSLGTLNTSFINGNFTGAFDGQGHTISGLSINSTQSNVGLFSRTSTSASISNLSLANVNITTTGSSVGALVGSNYGKVDNVAAEGKVSGYDSVGGLIGYNYNNTVKNSYANVDVNGNYQVGGFIGYNSQANADITNCYAMGDVKGNTSVGGFVGRSFDNATITNAYATGNVSGISDVGGFIGKMGWVNITNSYATGEVSGTGSHIGGFSGETWSDSGSVVDSTCFWNTDINTVGVGSKLGTAIFNAQGLTTSQIANNNYISNGGWDPTVWDLTGDTPTLMGTNNQDYGSLLEEYLRNGTYSLVRDADVYTQSPMSIGGSDYEVIDWRTVPQLYDELFKGDDASAENKYENTVTRINSQDKKLQLEQASIEVEYKAVSSEKEAVKKILDTNSQTSFKYFS
ncbi:MAG: GLUG motif-containing protein [Candidatus Gastranaerophilales bacterium]|nr:GLUG motif-containing protein [Candidatus Gastranaerophilales bacterium]